MFIMKPGLSYASTLPSLKWFLLNICDIEKIECQVVYIFSLVMLLHKVNYG